MSDKVEFDFSELTKFGIKFGRFRKILIDEHLVAKLANDARTIIEKRTLEGKKVTGGVFKHYSRKRYYRDKKECPIGKGGRRKNLVTGKPLQTIAYDDGYEQFAASTKRTGNTVTLHASGKMFQAFQAHELRPTKAIVSFNRSREAVKAKILTKQKGKFIGINPGEQAQLNKTGSRIVAKVIAKAGIK